MSLYLFSFSVINCVVTRTKMGAQADVIGARVHLLCFGTYRTRLKYKQPMYRHPSYGTSRRCGVERSANNYCCVFVRCPLHGGRDADRTKSSNGAHRNGRFETHCWRGEGRFDGWAQRQQANGRSIAGCYGRKSFGPIPVLYLTWARAGPVPALRWDSRREAAAGRARTVRDHASWQTISTCWKTRDEPSVVGQQAHR